MECSVHPAWWLFWRARQDETGHCYVIAGPSQISELVGSSAPCTCTRLARLASQGFCVGPRCNARKRWDLTPAGRAHAAAAAPVILDNLDKRILVALALAPLRLMALALRIETCPLTAKRRVNLLIARSLVSEAGGRFAISAKGREVLGEGAPRPWINVAAVSAAASKDVAARLSTKRLDDTSAAESSRRGSMAAAKALATARLNRSPAFNRMPLTG